MSGSPGAETELRVEQHPGPVAERRIYSAIDVGGGAELIHIQRDEDLFEVLEQWMVGSGTPGAAFRLLGGNVARLKVLTGRPGEATVATWAGPHDVPCPAQVLGGQGTVRAERAKCTIHTHATFIDAHGAARGCHLIRQQCVAGNGGIWVGIFPFVRSVFEVQYDPETTFDVFFPERLMQETAHAQEYPRGCILLVKLHPNEELYEGLESACREAGIACALILSGVGSLNDAWLTHRSPESRSAQRSTIVGPGLEIAGVTGFIQPGTHEVASQSQLTAWVTRADGTVTGGELARGLNAVCITFEFTLLETLPVRATPDKNPSVTGAGS